MTEIKKDDEAKRDETQRKIIDELKAKYPDQKLRRVIVDELPDELFVIRETNYEEHQYVEVDGTPKDKDFGRKANELLLAKYLVYPDGRNMGIIEDMKPGHVNKIVDEINRNLGFYCGVESKPL